MVFYPPEVKVSIYGFSEAGNFFRGNRPRRFWSIRTLSTASPFLPSRRQELDNEENVRAHSFGHWESPTTP